MNLAVDVEPEANFDNRRRLSAYAPILQPGCVVRDPRGSVFRQPQRDRAVFSPDADDRHGPRCAIDP